MVGGKLPGMRFDQRYGYTPVRLETQTESLDEVTRTHLWTALYVVFFDNYEPHTARAALQERMRTRLWLHFYNKPYDEAPSFYAFRDHVKTYFASCEWFKAYALLEGTAKAYTEPEVSAYFRTYVNTVLAEHLCDVRFVGEDLIRLTREEQVEAVDAALAATAPVSGARHHLEQAINHLRPDSADYPNSIKESISAVESAVASLLGERATLGAALKRVEDSTGRPLHPALKQAWSKMYGYTSDADGVRHAAFDKPDADADDALYFLVTCSAFVSYLLAKAGSAAG